MSAPIGDFADNCQLCLVAIGCACDRGIPFCLNCSGQVPLARAHRLSRNSGPYININSNNEPIQQQQRQQQKQQQQQQEQHEQQEQELQQEQLQQHDSHISKKRRKQLQQERQQQQRQQLQQQQQQQIRQHQLHQQHQLLEQQLIAGITTPDADMATPVLSEISTIAAAVTPGSSLADEESITVVAVRSSSISFWRGRVSTTAAEFPSTSTRPALRRGNGFTIPNMFSELEDSDSEVDVESTGALIAPEAKPWTETHSYPLTVLTHPEPISQRMGMVSSEPQDLQVTGRGRPFTDAIPLSQVECYSGAAAAAPGTKALSTEADLDSTRADEDWSSSTYCRGWRPTVPPYDSEVAEPPRTYSDRIWLPRLGVSTAITRQQQQQQREHFQRQQQQQQQPSPDTVRRRQELSSSIEARIIGNDNDNNNNNNNSNNFKIRMCSHRACRMGLQCSFAHGEVELSNNNSDSNNFKTGNNNTNHNNNNNGSSNNNDLDASKFKTQSRRNCTRGSCRRSWCAFAHGEVEIRYSNKDNNHTTTATTK
ncbi:unnamed protein product [Polarella glacialis]|uniref:C3H1-type domain-containing protein n=1 Tax=Polarella glacialis TaxID=89957 RepID=A0A813F6D7_POLGL|nr:unnamed protein product [Polarella glacialis]